jgi:uncharacterized protein (TIGR03083 family)
MVSLAQVGSAIDVRPVFVKTRAALLSLLPELSSQEWTAPTVCPGWAVKDIAVHLLHDDLRRLSRTRDGYCGGPAPATGQGPVEFLNSANQRRVTETGFLSPGLLVDLLARTSPLVEAMWAGADLHAPSEGVWWAGIDLAPAWLDIARDFTEDWTHQQQIRDAVGRPGLTEAQFLDPLIDTFLRALPNTYRHVPAGQGDSVLITIDDHGTLRALRNWPNRSSTSCPLCAEDRLELDAARACLSAGSSFEAAGASRAKAVDLEFLCGRRQARPAWIG